MNGTIVLPSEQRLLEGIRDALKAAMSEDSTSRTFGLMAAATVGVDELIIRADSAFWASYHRRGIQLIETGDLLVRKLAQLGDQPVDEPKDRPAWAFEGNTEVATQRELVDRLRIDLTRLTGILGREAGVDADVSEYLSQVVDWENELHARRLRPSQPIPSAEAAGSGFTKEAVQRYLRDKHPEWGEVLVTESKKLPGGFSKTTVLVDCVTGNGDTRSMVIRAEQEVTLVFFDGAEIENEYRVLRLLYRFGRRVPQPLWLESDCRYFGVKFLVSEKAKGRNVGTAVAVHEAVEEPLLVDLITNLLSVHRTPINATDEDVMHCHLARWRSYQTLEESTRANVEYWREQVDSMGLPASPIIRRVLDWLANHVPRSDEAPSLIHRDYGMHNILVSDDSVSSILDWECATMGDPAEDLAWMTDSMKSRVDRQRILDLYSRASGEVVPESRLRFFDVFTSLKYAVTCSQALALFEKNPAVPISACQLGLLYPYHGTAGLNNHLKAAQAAGCD